MTMRVLLTGNRGQLGQDLTDTFADVDLVGVDIQEVDIADEAQVQALVRDVQPTHIINSAAYTAVDACEDHADLAHQVNALGPWYLARAAKDVGASLVHISTDYVFDGTGTEALTEFDAVAPLGVYGRTKAAGEQLVRETLPEHHIVRTAWVNGARGNNFVKTMLRLGRERDELGVVADQHGSPTFTRDLAPAIREIIEAGRHGTVHRTNAGQCTWYDLAVATFEEAGVDVVVKPLTTAEYPTKSARPAWSVLSNDHARLQGLTELRPWREGLQRMLAELAELEA